MQPAVCTHPAHPNRSSGSGSAKLVNTKVHSGPFAACSYFEVGTNDTLWYQCAMRNRYGNWWINVNYYGTGQKMNGWVYQEDVAGPWPVAHC